MTREEVLAYFDMELDLTGILPDYMYEDSEQEYGFEEYLYDDGSNEIVPECGFSYISDEGGRGVWWELAKQFLYVEFREYGIPFPNVYAEIPEECRAGEIEMSRIQGQDVRIVRCTVKRESVEYGEYYVADFMSGDLGVAITARGMDWETVQKTIEYLVYYALQREGGE